MEERRKMNRDQIQHNRNAMTTGRELRDFQDLIEAVDNAIVDEEQSRPSYWEPDDPAR